MSCSSKTPQGTYAHQESRCIWQWPVQGDVKSRSGRMSSWWGKLLAHRGLMDGMQNACYAVMWFVFMTTLEEVERHHLHGGWTVQPSQLASVHSEPTA